MGEAFITRKSGIGGNLKILADTHVIKNGNNSVYGIEDLDFAKNTYIVNIGGKTNNGHFITDTYVIQNGEIIEKRYGYARYMSTIPTNDEAQTFRISISINEGKILVLETSRADRSYDTATCVLVVE